ncbi:MAG: hypothetical protein C5B51_13620 [Terriglobia bacterium]|nr:MAG: hypothetical protein C5B51_13620 [Terriglobia bacterium]
MIFRLYPLRFVFAARESIHFPIGKSANILRGAFGTIFRRMVCLPSCTDTRGCDWQAICPYARMFEPGNLAQSPSGLSDWPRPFVFRATHLDGSTVPAGGHFHFDLNLFDLEKPAIAYLVTAFAQLAQEGLGPHHGRADLISVWRRNQAGEVIAPVFEDNSFRQEGMIAAHLSLQPASTKVESVSVRFLSPTELKTSHGLADRPEFGVLASRIRDRLSTLRNLYDGGPLEIDFCGFGERASRVRLTRCHIHRIEVVRQSSRSGKIHSIGGFIGEAEYEGDLAEFVPYLEAARWTGVGRQTVWGKGEISMERGK